MSRSNQYYQDIGDCLSFQDGSNVTIVGRVLNVHKMGKVCFCDLVDDSGVIQLYIRLHETDEVTRECFQNCSDRDIVAVNGQIFFTQRGEKSVRVRNVILQSPNLR